MNSDIFNQFGDQLRTHYEYTWSKREVTAEGSTIEQLLTFGIDRPKYSCDVLGAFLKVRKLHRYISILTQIYMY